MAIRGRMVARPNRSGFEDLVQGVTHPGEGAAVREVDPLSPEMVTTGHIYTGGK
jgi:hypothetical protein